MIGAASDSFVARLTERARQLALAQVENRRLAKTHDPARWRRAALLWPDFTRPTFTGER